MGGIVFYQLKLDKVRKRIKALKERENVLEEEIKRVVEYNKKYAKKKNENLERQQRGKD